MTEEEKAWCLWMLTLTQDAIQMSPSRMVRHSADRMQSVLMINMRVYGYELVSNDQEYTIKPIEEK